MIVSGTEPASADIALPRELSGTVWRPDGNALYPGYVWLIWRGGELPRYFSVLGPTLEHLGQLPPVSVRVHAVWRTPPSGARHGRLSRRAPTLTWALTLVVMLATGTMLVRGADGIDPSNAWRRCCR